MILFRRSPDHLSEIVPLWAGHTVVCIAGGPSLTAEQCAAVGVARLAGRVRVIGVNDAYRRAPWADVLYFADAKWWEWHKHRFDFIAFAGQKCTISGTHYQIRDGLVHVLKNGGVEGVSTDPRELRTGRNGGFQALNMAILAGARRVLLLGYDARAVDGRRHWFGDHPKIEPDHIYNEYRAAFHKTAETIAAMGVQVINCSPDSAITCFEKAPLESALADPSPALV